MGDDNYAVYEDDENVYYRASAFGNCIRELAATRQGIVPNVPSDKMQGYFDEGHDHEEEILDRFHDKIGKKEWERLGGQGEIRLSAGSFQGKRLWIVGHYDERFASRKTGEIRIAEVKFLAPSSIRKINFSKLEPLHSFPYYIWQRDIYMVAQHEPLWYVLGVKDRDDDGTASLTDVIYHLFDRPVNGITAIIKRTRRIESLAASELPDCDVLQFPCPMFGSICASGELRDKLKAEKGPVVELADEVKEALDHWCAQYEYGKGLMEDGTRRAKEAVEGIIAIQMELGLRKSEDEILESGTGNLRGNQWEMDWISFEKQGNVDWKKVPSDTMQELDKYRKEGTKVAYPKVKVKGMEEALAKGDKTHLHIGTNIPIDGDGPVTIVRKKK